VQRLRRLLALVVRQPGAEVAVPGLLQPLRDVGRLRPVRERSCRLSSVSQACSW
jgi:hypothetical protein